MKKASVLLAIIIVSCFTQVMVRFPSVAGDLSPHSPILIDGDGNFTVGNGVTSGNGTSTNPYVIENWDINASTADGIVIRNTTAHFVMRNVSLHSGSPGHKGLFIMNVTNGTIHNVTAVYNFIGMSIYLSTNVTISSSHINNNTLGMRMNWSDNSTISGTEFRNNTWLSLSLINSSHNDIVSSIFSGNGSGISLILSHNNRIDGN
ncbi:MAG: right-handed parallel beta-helix repeat-containing protein, partial [Thermoplasmata archaeon]